MAADQASISIHAPRVGSDRNRSIRSRICPISIHAPRVGSDRLPAKLHVKLLNFNPRSPCGERLNPQNQMLYTPAISIHAPRVGSDFRSVRTGLFREFISIHAPRVGSDNMVTRLSGRITTFQSTLPVWGATALAAAATSTKEISIHAPRVGSDSGANRRSIRR